MHDPCRAGEVQLDLRHTDATIPGDAATPVEARTGDQSKTIGCSRIGRSPCFAGRPQPDQVNHEAGCRYIRQRVRISSRKLVHRFPRHVAAELAF
jgi:hypothetical protein